MSKSSWDYEVTIDDIEYDNDSIVEVTVRYWGYDIPAKLTGHPDNMYPGEGEDEIELIELILISEEDVEVDLQQPEVDEIWDKIEAEVLQQVQREHE